MKIAIVTGSIEEFNLIQTKESLKNAKAFIWKPDYSVIDKHKNIKDEGYGEDLDKSMLAKATSEIHKTLQNWYLDINGNDLSQINGVSLGLTFESSIELIFYNITQTYLSFQQLSKKYDQVFVSESGDPIKVFVAEWFNNHQEKKFKIISTVSLKKSNTKRVHPMSQFRDLRFLFRGRWYDSFLSFIILNLQFKAKKSIYIMDAGKFDGFFTYRKNKDLDIKYLVPIRRNLKNIFGNLVFWQRTNTKVKNNKITSITECIDKFGWTQDTTIVPMSLYKASIEDFIYLFWPSAMKFYSHNLKIFTRFKPKVAVYGTDGVELFLLSAYAAKQLKIKTVMMPHGLAGWFNSSMQKNDNCVFDYYLSTGDFDTNKYLKNGQDEKKIVDISLPWFSDKKFNTKRKRFNNKSPLNAVIVPFDPGYSLEITPNYMRNHLKDMIDVCKELSINIVGIKLRDAEIAKSYGLKDGENDIFNQKIFIYSGYGEMYKLFDGIDIAIGTIGSITVECLINQIPYYSYYDCSIYNGNPNLSYPNLKETIHIASKKEELKNNINNQLIYKNNFDINSIINFEDSFGKACSSLEIAFEDIMKG
jgi:hypothetical protein